MKKYLWQCLLLVSCMQSYGQSAGISGTIRDATGKSVPFAHITLEPGGTVAMTDADGDFQLVSVAPGSYKLTVSCVGYRSLQQEVTLRVGEKTTLTYHLEASTSELETIIVTATRNEQNLEDVPMPVQVISGEKISQMGSVRLNEVLMEQTGMQVIGDHGTGLQMQGLSSDYILILIDGEPVIGRTAGTLDLTRLAVGNIERVEVLKGPSSSLYGSEAMAGVVNIITKKGTENWQTSLRSQFRSYNTWDADATLGYRSEKLTTSIFFNRLSSDGYDLTPESVGKTIPQYQAYTLNPKVAYKFSNQWEASVSGRFYTENQQNEQEVSAEEENLRIDDQGWRKDWSLMPQLTFRPNENHRINIRHYLTGYKTESELTYVQDGAMYDESFFNQTFNRTELQYDWSVTDRQTATFGLGHVAEEVEATRYENVNAFRTNYLFAQYQWEPTYQWNIVGGGRLDVHNQYADRFSPKLAVGYKPWSWLRVQASVGGGYKAPDFRQLLLSFTNPVAGYSVFGSQVVAENMARLEAEGQIDQIFIDPTTIQEIKAESSWAFNAGFTLIPTEKLTIRVNLFRNDIQDLIETGVVARKTNGQSVFSYFNISKVITQGIETNIDYPILPGLTMSLGYHFLDTRDEDAWQSVKNGEVYRRNQQTNRTERVTTADYGGLFNRSKHAGNVKLFYENDRYFFSVALRGIYRGRWGVGDMNGNAILDADQEYADGYLLWNLSLTKQFNWLNVEAGVNNITDQTNQNEASLAGRVWYAGAGIELHQLFKSTN